MRFTITIMGGAWITDVTNRSKIQVPAPNIIIGGAIQVNGGFVWFDSFEQVTYRVNANDVMSAEAE